MLNKQQLYKGISNAGCGAVGLEVFLFFHKTPLCSAADGSGSCAKKSTPLPTCVGALSQVAAGDYGSGAQVGYLARVRR